MENYNFKTTEKKWQKYWEDNNNFYFDKNKDGKKYYVLSMLPYPSGELHVGHLSNYMIGDITARFKRMQGYNVLHPMGADAFGLPAENAAIKRKIHPEDWTKQNIEKFIFSMKKAGLSLDFSKYIATCFPDYYGKQQTMFLKMLKNDLCYQKDSFVNWDPVDQTVLANEQVVDGRGWRSGALVEKKKLKQWFFRTTKYAEELLNDIDDKLQGWPERIRLMQKNWIGKSEGALVNFDTVGDPVGYVRQDRETTVMMDCKEPWFSAIKNGTKTIEGRKVNSIYLMGAKEGAVLELESTVTHERIKVRVVKSKIFKNVREYLENNDLSKIAPFSNDIDEVEKMYRDMVKDIDNYEYIAYYIERIFDKITVFTTRPDTLFGASFIGISANHPIAETLARDNKEIKDFIEDCKKTSVDEETLETMEKKGINTGIKVKHPFIVGAELPVYVANFILMDYGTGAIFGCPAHDQRDFDFAKKYNLPIKAVVSPDGNDFKVGNEAFTEEGIAINSYFLDGLSTKEAKAKAIEKIEELGIGEKKVNYRLRDWGFSRQRYWGCPIPVVYCEKCGVVPLKEEDLPLELPKDVEFTGKGNPLENHPTWKHTKCPHCGADAVRETDTMDTFVDSSWYFLRYLDLTEPEPFNAKLCEEMLPIDQYIGGPEHATMHLIYCRFFTKALRDCGYFNIDEPVKKLFNQGMVCHKAYRGKVSKDWCYPWDLEEKEGKFFNRETGEELSYEGIIKMSKSKSNVVDILRIIDAYGADSARMFIVSDTPADKDYEWTEQGIEGCWRYINKFFKTISNFKERYNLQEINFANDIIKTTHKTIKAVTKNLENLEFNVAIAKIREATNFLEKVDLSSEENKKSYYFAVVNIVKLFIPIAPHLCSELLEILDVKDLDWPSYDEALTEDENVTIAVQVNGKLRTTVDVAKDMAKEELENIAKSNENVKKYTDGKEIKKIIVVPNKLINFVI